MAAWHAGQQTHARTGWGVTRASGAEVDVVLAGLPCPLRSLHTVMQQPSPTQPHPAPQSHQQRSTCSTTHPVHGALAPWSACAPRRVPQRLCTRQPWPLLGVQCMTLGILPDCSLTNCGARTFFPYMSGVMESTVSRAGCSISRVWGRRGWGARHGLGTWQCRAGSERRSLLHERLCGDQVREVCSPGKHCWYTCSCLAAPGEWPAGWRLS